MAPTVLERAGGIGQWPWRLPPPLLRTRMRSHDSDPNFLSTFPCSHPHPRIWVVCPEDMAAVEFKSKPAWLQSPRSLCSWSVAPQLLRHLWQTNEATGTDTIMTWPLCVVDEGGRKPAQWPILVQAYPCVTKLPDHSMYNCNQWKDHMHSSNVMQGTPFCPKAEKWPEVSWVRQTIVSRV